MKINLCVLVLLWGAILPFANGEEVCVSDNPAISAIQKQWLAPQLPGDRVFAEGFRPTSLQLLPKSQAEGLFGLPNIKSRKTMLFFNQYAWTIETDGDYWLVADSGAWLDVRDGQQALEPITFNHGLRCAGIYKALKFHLPKGRYVLIVASDATDKVKIAAELER